MRRIIFIATVVTFVQGVGGFQQVPQTSTAITTLRSIRVNAQTISALPKGKKYVVDLTQRGVRYEFDAKSRVDFTRVMVKTAQGEVPIGTYLKKVPFKSALTGFKYTSQPFSIGTKPATATLNPNTDNRPNVTTTTNFKCDKYNCSCVGMWDCMDLIYGTSLCAGEDSIFCGTQPDGKTICWCVRA